MWIFINAQIQFDTITVLYKVIIRGGSILNKS